LKERDIYKEDWLGLKALDKKGGLHFKTAPGKHMQLSEELLNKTFADYFGPEGSNKKSWGDRVQQVLGDWEL